MSMINAGTKVVMTRWNKRSLKTHRTTFTLANDSAIGKKVLYGGHWWMVESVADQKTEDVNDPETWRGIGDTYTQGSGQRGGE